MAPDFLSPDTYVPPPPLPSLDSGSPTPTTDGPIEQSPPGQKECKAGLNSEGSRWVKKKGGSQSIRATPSATGAVVGTVKEGEKMAFFPSASKNGWACILHQSTYGFVDAMALTTTPPAGSFSCKPGHNLKQDGFRWVKKGTGALNLRSEPSASGGTATVITTIPESPDAKATYYPEGDDPGWACLAFANKVGFASAKYLASSPPKYPSTGGGGCGSGGGGYDPSSGNDPSSYSGSGKCVTNVNVGCWWFTKPCEWRTTKGDCLSPHWKSGEQCCIWNY
jgi:hypothetical protein